MKSLKETIMVSTLSLGLIVGAVAAVNAATSVDLGPTATMTTVPPTTDSSMDQAPVAAAPVAAAPPQNFYQYNDGHSNMNPQQHQQMHVSATNNINGNGYATNHNNNEMHNTMGENHMNGGQYGYGHE
ncbi:hypothetical protein [Desulfosporosinus sp.]|uniref:hypothetical protein n=1 Tax=Desulfosporosinus sp. TaxID=157907 RepID=UPI0023182B26|nr:hypothetical protein [Desulfosporosinus sp.]MDA8222085.1 hypothetical protein [Desulfitobacterium hafniense]